MPTHLFIAPTLATALTHRAATPPDAARRWLLTPVKLEDAALSAYEGNWQMATLAEQLLTLANIGTTIAPTLYALRLLTVLMEGLAETEQLPTLKPVARKRGMVREVNRWIRELQTQGVSPATIGTYDPANNVEGEMTLIYTAYLAALAQSNQADTDGIVGAAVAALEADAVPDLSDLHLTVMGFDQFEPTPLRFLQLLSERVAQLDIYLAGDLNRPAEALALARLRYTYLDLQKALMPDDEVALPFPAAVPAPLQHLHTTLFEPAPAYPNEGGVIRAHATASREGEVRAALREVLNLRSEGVDPADITILAPDLSPYQRLLQAVAYEYNVPLRLSQPLTDNPAVAALVALLTLAPRFPRRETLDALRSPYLHHGFSVAELDMLDRLTRERPVIATLDQWLSALQPYRGRAESDSVKDEDLGPPPLWQTVKAEVMDNLREKVRALFRLLTPHDYAASADHRRWIVTTLLGLENEGQSQESLGIAVGVTEAATAERDQPALDEVTKILNLLSRTIGNRGRLSWATYRADLLDLLGDMMIEIPAPPDAIVVQSLSEGRRRTMPHLLVLGLNEGDFPRPPAPDLFYAPAERQSHPHLRREFQGDDASLWWQTLSNVTRTLTLLRPRLDDKGNSTLASPYWDAVVAAVSGVTVVTPRVDEVPTWEESISLNEQVVAVAADSSPSALPAPVRALWDIVTRADAIRAQRESVSLEAGGYEGVVQEATILDELERRYGATRDWSVSQLHHYAECPYGFFAQHVLALRPMTDPEEGLDARIAGQIYHTILEDLYRWMQDTDCLPAPDHRASILQEVDVLCDEYFRTAAARYQFRPGVLWQQEQNEMRRHLHALLSWECEQDRRHVPVEQERRFGNITRSQQVILELNADGLPFRLQGVIDRIDRDADGETVHIVDYKSGNGKYSDKKIENGRALQTPLYALALERMGAKVASSRYLLIRKREESGALTFSGAVGDHPVVQAALASVSTFMQNIRLGYFPAAPAEPTRAQRACRDGCDFAGICRVTRVSIKKAKDRLP